jgi:serine/threonine-protein kinase HipA
MTLIKDTFQPTSLVSVYFVRGDSKQPLGRLFLKDRRLFFEYDTSFLNSGLQLSPFKLPLKNGIITSEDRVFDGLFGLFNDSLPDGWGRLLMDRKLMKAGLNPNALSPLDRLCMIGSHGMGALIYEPEHYDGSRLASSNLDEIAQEIKNFQGNDDDFYVDKLLISAGSSSGARPKILTQLGDENWLVKFKSNLDPKDIGNIEYAYHLMAKNAGLDVAPARLFPSQTGSGYFGVKRFDHAKGQRVHMHTISGLLHADHREPSLDYGTILKATLWLTHDVYACEKQFRNAVFNVLSHNRDDHAKNFSFLMDEQGKWSVSPAYDLTFSSGINGEHSTMVMGEGKTPGLQQLLKLAELGDIKKSTALEIIEEVKLAISRWKQFADMGGVSKMSLNRILGSLAARITG